MYREGRAAPRGPGVGGCQILSDMCRPLTSQPIDETVQPKPILRIEEVFGSHFELTEGGTPWLEPAVQSIENLRGLCD